MNSLELLRKGAGSERTPTRALHVGCEAGRNDGAWVGRSGETAMSAINCKLQGEGNSSCPRANLLLNRCECLGQDRSQLFDKMRSICSRL